MRTFSGSEQFEALKTTVVDAYKKSFPVERNGFKLELKKIWVDDSGVDPDDFTTQKKTKVTGQTWGAPVFADIELRDPSGKLIDHMTKVRFSTVPRLTPRGSYIVGGNEYQIHNQLLRRPGIYVVKRQTGDQYKANFNIAGDGARNFEMHFDPISNKFHVQLGQKKIPLYPLLNALGVSDTELGRSWGDDVLAANRRSAPSEVIKFANSLSRQQQTDNAETAKDILKQYIKTTKLDPKVTEVTIGHAYDHLHPGAVLATSNKLLNVYRGKQEADDPENLLFKHVLSTEDMLHDLLNAPHVQQGIKNTLTKKLGSKMAIKEIIDFHKLSGHVENFFARDTRSNTPEQTNPMHMLSGLHKITIMGTGGITDPHQITTELREVHPSHAGFIDPVATPESQKIGANLHLAAGILKDGRDVRTGVTNARTGKLEYLTPRELYGKVFAFPDDVNIKDGKVTFKKEQVKGQQAGKFGVFKPSQIEYVLPSHTTLFSYSTNMIPFLHHDQGNRAMMGAKMIDQALSLVDREAPLVQTTVGKGDKTFHQAIGSQFSLRSPVDGVVKAVHPDYIQIGGSKIPLYNNFPLNQKSFMSHETVVKPGDKVKKGQLLADTNFTKGGELALGKNLHVAYLPYPGLTFEDGIVITESAAKKLATQTMYQHDFQIEPGVRIADPRKYMAYFGNDIPKEKLKEYDDHGIIRKGMAVTPGQVLIMGLHYDLNNPDNLTLRKVNRALEQPWSKAAVKYTGEFPGVVTDVVKTGKTYKVLVKAIEPAKESDKLSGIHGNKGVITKVIADKDAPRTKDGVIPDVFLNPHGIISRINIGQIYESVAGKIADKTGKTYKVTNFESHDTAQNLDKQMKALGITDKEEMVLPNGKSIGRVHVGKPYILRLAKTGKSGFSARMPGLGYDLNMQPIKGGEEGSKNLDLMTFYSMLSHGAKKNLIDGYQKSERNDEYWHAIETGRPLPAPKPSFAYNKFISMLHGAGINTVKNGAEITLAPMTDKDVAKLSNGKVDEPEFLYGKDLKPKKGGFFDPGVTGGLFGNRYSHIELKEPVPNPVFEGAISAIAGLKEADYAAVMAGKKFVTKQGNLVDKDAPGVLHGGHAIQHLLKGVDVNVQLQQTYNAIRAAKKEEDINRLNRKARYLKALQDLNMKPEEAYMRTKIPVIPPINRPVYTLPNGVIQASSSNLLYQNVGILNKAHDYPVMKLMPEVEKGALREELYNATRAVAGLEEVHTRGKDQPMRGFISEIAGAKSPKGGFFINKVITKRQDLVGRGVITAAPDLDVDQLGIPEKMAWVIFRPFVVREFIKSGYKPDMARKEIDSQSKLAKTMLESALKSRTIMMNRAPSLHKFSVMAFKPVLTDGLAVRVPPLVLKGFGGDFDGDAVTLHVPTSEEAVRESMKMLPSQNLWKPGTGELMIMPSQESAIGLYFMSQTPEGRKKINEILPKQFHIDHVLDKKGAKELYNRIAKEDPKQFAGVVNKLKLIGDEQAYQKGFSVGLHDVLVDHKPRDAAFAAADKVVADIRRRVKPGPQQDAEVSKVYQDASKKAYELTRDQLKAKGNSFYHMVTSGARGNDSQLMQIVSAPGIMKDSKDRPIPVPVKSSYAEGLDSADYFLSMYGARKGMMDRALQTAWPGALSKDLMANVMDNVIMKDDCGTRRGITLPVTGKDVLTRVLSKDQYGFKAGQLVTPQITAAIQKKGGTAIDVRSPLTCALPKGTCSKCFGHDEHQQFPEIGDNIGVRMGQTISEPLTQMTMKTFHTGGIAGAGPSASGFERIKQLLKMPKYIAAEATLAEQGGKVTKIAPSPAGGHVVWVGDTKHTVRPGLDLKVKAGSEVGRGDALSNGVMKPQDIVKHKGMAPAQNYLVDELQKAFAEQDVSMHRKVFETVVRSVGNLTKVVSAPKDSGVLPGDFMPFTEAQHYNMTRMSTVPVHEALGSHLFEETGGIAANTELKEKDIHRLKQLGYNQIAVVKAPILHTPQLKGVERLPITRRNWMAQLGYQHLKDTLTEGAAQAWKTNVESTHPIPAFAHGASFGKKKEHY